MSFRQDKFDPPRTESLLAVVLCGGKSTRMGRDKSQLLYHGGETFLQLALTRADKICRNVCILPGENEIGVEEVDSISDSVAESGPAAAVAGALQTANHKEFAGILVTPVDMPDLLAEHLYHLVQQWQAEPERIACGVCTSGGESRLQPLVAIYPTIFQSQLEELAKSENRSLYRWLKTQEVLRVELPTNACRNVNRPEDLGGSMLG